MTRITATEAVRSFSDLLNRAVYRRESFEVERGGQVVAVVTPAPRTGSLRDLALELSQQGYAPVPGLDEAMAEARTYGSAEPEDPWQR